MSALGAKLPLPLTATHEVDSFPQEINAENARATTEPAENRALTPSNLTSNVKPSHRGIISSLVTGAKQARP